MNKKKNGKEKTLRCSVCGEYHLASETELFFRRPDAIISLTEDERTTRCKESDDLCVIKWERYFVRGVIPIKVEGREVNYCIGAWVEVSETDFKRIVALWQDPNQEMEPPFNGKLANSIPISRNSFGLNVELRLVSPTKRCEIYILDKQCELFGEQSAGISEHRAFEYTGVGRHKST
jgi:hypothetical protein